MRTNGVVFACLITASAAGAQAHSNLSGKWEYVRVKPMVSKDTSTAKATRMAKNMNTIDIVQTNKQVTISDAKVSGTYTFDGQESTNYVLLGETKVPEVGRARWQGGRLVITAHMESGRTKTEYTKWLYLRETGELVMEYRGYGRGKPFQATSVFRKQISAAR